MPGDILGEPNKYSANGFVGSDTAGGAFIGYRGRRLVDSAPALAAGNFGGGGASGDFSGPSRPAPPSSEPVQPTPVQEVNVTPINQTSTASEDTRVKIRVPSDYLTGLTSGLQDFGGVLFPYTPQITLEHKAEYTSQNPTHSNYTLQFYKTSSVGEITITGKFTVQNDRDALIYLATSHLLSSLTKMRWGGIGNGDPDSGAPPPVCRLDAYGTFMLKNVPVVISSFKHDLPDDVDFYTVMSGPFGMASVPTKATFIVNCKPAYSRQEILSTSVTKYLKDPATRQKGFL